MHSPNFGPRRFGLTPEIVVVHFTAMARDAALERLCDPAYEVSAHYLIDRSGEVIVLVDEGMRAWHAGAGRWRGLDDINSRSIGIELVNLGHEPFSAPQMDALEIVLAEVIARHDICLRNVIGHSDMAPERKQDPGRRFDWARLARGGLALSSPPPCDVPLDATVFQQNCQRFGYPNAPLVELLAAFRARFRPAAFGPLDLEDCAQASALAAL